MHVNECKILAYEPTKHIYEVCDKLTVTAERCWTQTEVESV